MLNRKLFVLVLFLEMFFCFEVSFASSIAVPGSPIDSVHFVMYKGLVVDHKSGSPLAFASILLDGTNITTVTNTEGVFSLKVPKKYLNGTITITFLGYKSRVFSLAGLNAESNRLELDILTRVLPEISVVMSDAASLISAVVKKKGENYSDSITLMTAFYRETIRKRKTYVSLQEAVVDIYKYPYTSDKEDWASLYKVRKSADYHKLDTLVFRLMGGPYNNLYADIMKNSDEFFSDEMMKKYEFSFDRSVLMNDRTVYVVDFKQLPSITEPLYFGTLYIDAESLALISAEFGLNLDNREEASKIFIKKKPNNAKVYPTRSLCKIDYLQRGDKWYFNYCRVELDIYIDWKRKLFNTMYLSTIELAVTDWTSSNVESKWLKPRNRLKVTDIVANEASGFNDQAFWGEMNVIEPEKSIQTAIKKIQKQLKNK